MNLIKRGLVAGLLVLSCVAGIEVLTSPSMLPADSGASVLAADCGPSMLAAGCGSSMGADSGPLMLAADSDVVAFNTSNGKYHDKSCKWAIKCTAHCVDITRAEAHRRGGIPCKVCNGGE